MKTVTIRFVGGSSLEFAASDALVERVKEFFEDLRIARLRISEKDYIINFDKVEWVAIEGD